jgi:hypothetical protein
MPLAPTVLGINLWLLQAVVPLWLAQGAVPRWLLGSLPLPCLLLLLGMRFRRHLWAQVVLLVGFPMLLTLTDALGSLGIDRLSPQLAVVLKLSVFVGYLATTCHLLARESLPDDPLRLPVSSWVTKPLDAPPSSRKLRRRAATHAMLQLLCVVMPGLLFFAICLHKPNVRQLLRMLGSPAKVTALQATLLAAATMLWASLFYFGVMRPLKLHIGHDAALRGELGRLRQASRRGKARPQLFVAMAVALAGMAALLFFGMGL